MQLSRNLAAVYAAAFLRSASIGLLGFVLAAGLAGSAAANAVTGRYSQVWSRRRVLVMAAVLSAAGGVGLAFVHSAAALILLAFICMINGMGTDRSAAFAVEQAVIPGLVSDQDRTWTLSWYNVVLDASGALGALSGALPIAIRNWAGMGLMPAYRWVFLLYTALNLASAALYLLLDAQVEASAAPQLQPGLTSNITPASRSLVRRISLLFAVDSAGGGFLADALLAYWFFERFGVNEKGLGLLFFVVRVFNALSHLGAAWIAKRIGLVRTMVFTHLPSSVFLMMVPLMPNFASAAVLLLMREALVEMDVPTRQSYLAAVVQPHERVYASSVTNLTRTGAWALSASVAGALMQHVAFSAPLVLGGSMKIAYDFLLYRSFRHVRPPEEAQAAGS